MDDETYFFFTDETNKDPSGKSRFFIYGGVFVRSAPLRRYTRQSRRFVRGTASARPMN